MRFLVTSRRSVTTCEFCPVAVVPAYSVKSGVRGAVSEDSGFFQFGDSAICFGQSAGCAPSKKLTHTLPDVSQSIECEGETAMLAVLISSRSSRTCLMNDTTNIPGIPSNKTLGKTHRGQSII